MVLETAVDQGSRTLESKVLLIMQAMSGTLQRIPSYDNPIQAKNYNEVLRCYEIIARSFTDEVISFALHREGFENPQPLPRRAACHLLKHLVTRLVDELKAHRGLLVTGSCFCIFCLFVCLRIVNFFDER
jgi:hypothetical protein